MSDIEKGIISKENSQQCDYCGLIKELRPYGKNGACICFDCGMKPENIREVNKNFEERLNKFTGG